VRHAAPGRRRRELTAYAEAGEVYTDPDVVACTREALGRPGGGPPVAQPTREQLTAALSR
jgi:hypothetical protein